MQEIGKRCDSIASFTDFFKNVSRETFLILTVKYGIIIATICERKENMGKIISIINQKGGVGNNDGCESGGGTGRQRT